LDATALSQLAADFDEADQKRLALQRELGKLEEAAKAFKAALMTELERGEVKAIGCEAATFTLKFDTEPTVTDKEAFHKYVYDNHAIDLLQARLSGPAVKARWEDDVAIPGVSKFLVAKLSRKGN